MAATGINHVGRTVSDIRKSTEFYELLGFTKLSAEPVDLDNTGWTNELLGFPENHMIVQHMSIGSSATMLELLQYVTPAGETLLPSQSCDTGNAHMAIEVDDIEAEHERLTAAGIEFFSTRPVAVPADDPFAGVTALYFRDPDGMVTEIIQWDR